MYSPSPACAGSLSQVDAYDISGNVVSFDIYTNDSEGLRLKRESYLIFDSVSVLTRTTVYEYDNNVLKMTKNYKSLDSRNQLILDSTTVYTIFDGRKMKEETFNTSNIKTSSSTFYYDNFGKRVSTHSQTFDFDGSVISEMTSTRTYNTNGTLSTVSIDNSETRVFLWEQIETLVNFDTFFAM